MTWLDAAPSLGAAIALLLLPGLLVVWVTGVRGLMLPALAPVGSVAVIAAAAVLAQLGHVRFGLLPVGVTTLVVALVLGVVRWFGGRRSAAITRQPTDEDRSDLGRRERRSLVAGLLGTVVGGMALGVGLIDGLDSPDRWPQTFDAVFHLSAVEHIVSTGDGSSLTLGTVSAPAMGHVFYPAAWHDLAALVATVTGAAVPVAANSVALAAAAVAWPLGCAGLARVAFGPRPVVVATAAILAAGLTASPVVLSSYGTLWPNALATAVLPAALALLVDLVGAGKERVIPPLPGCVLLVGALGGVGLAHPNVAVSLLVLAVPVLLFGTWSRGLRWRLGSLTYGLLVSWLLLWSPAFAGLRGTSWPMRQSIPQAAGEWLTLAPQRLPAPYVLAGLTLLGCVAAWRNPRLRWLVASHATAGALFALIAGSDGRWSRMVSAAWWDDPFRLAALAGVAGVPLAALGVDAIAQGARRALTERPRSGFVRIGAAVMVVSLLASVLLVSLEVGQTSKVVGWWYGSDSLLLPAESALVKRLPDYVAAGEKVVGNPWNGAALTGPLGEREAVFPHLGGTWDPDRVLLAQGLSGASHRPDVCAALARLDVKYVLTNTPRFWPDDRRRTAYDGLDVEGMPGFEAVARGGNATLWKVTACGS